MDLVFDEIVDKQFPQNKTVMRNDLAKIEKAIIREIDPGEFVSTVLKYHIFNVDAQVNMDTQKNT